MKKPPSFTNILATKVFPKKERDIHKKIDNIRRNNDIMEKQEKD